MNEQALFSYLGAHFGAIVSGLLAAASGIFALYLNYRSQKSKEAKEADEREKGISEEERERIKSIFDGGDQFQVRLIEHLENVQIQLNASLARENEWRTNYLQMQTDNVSLKKVMDELIVKEKLALTELERIRTEYDGFKLKFVADMQAKDDAYKALEGRYHELEALLKKYQNTPPTVDTSIKI